MISGLHTVAETVELIKRGRILLLAGEESLLAQMPPGKWIGGTAVSFMTPKGGTTDCNNVFVTDLTDIAETASVRQYTADSLPNIGADYLSPGFTVLIVPAASEVHARFAGEVQSYPGVFDSPLVGWISGVAVAEIGKRQAKVFAGNNAALSDKAVALHIGLPAGKAAVADIINLFTPGNGPAITFPRNGFASTGDCRIDGVPANLARYIADRSIDTKLPLIADYNGAMINVSIQSANAESGEVCFYAPVFEGVEYRFANPVGDYTHAFEQREAIEGVAFSCNCILNFLYADLEGKTIGSFSGPITFGEIAYMLLNQTLVYLRIVDVA